MKKLIILFTILGLLLVVLPLAVEAEYATSGPCGTNASWTLDNDGVLTISGTGDMQNYYPLSPGIPDLDRSKVKSIVIQNGITSIGDYAFYYCIYAESVTIPPTVKTIGERAFYNCGGGGPYSRLRSITIPYGVQRINSRAFYDCGSLTSIVLPNSITYVANDAFEKCERINYFKYPDGYLDTHSYSSLCDFSETKGTCGENSIWELKNNTLTISGTGAVRRDGWNMLNSDNFNKLVVCEGITSITKFSSSLLTEADLPDSLASIGDYVFSGCTGLTEITIPDNVTSIGSHAFSWCSGLTELVIPNQVNSIGSFAFYCCSGLTNLVLPDQLSSIGLYAFGNCNSLERITVSCINTATIQWLKNNGFADIIHIPFHTAVVTDEAVEPNCTQTGLTEGSHCACCGEVFTEQEVIPRRHSEVPDAAVAPTHTTIGLTEGSHCALCGEVLTPQQEIPITESGPYSRKGSCGSNLTWVLFEDGELVITGTGQMRNYDRTSSYDCAPWRGLTFSRIIICEGVESIGRDAFAAYNNNREGCTEIIITDTVTSIGSYAFLSCTGLTDITIPDSVTNIGYGAFQFCSGLTDVTLPNGPINFDGYPFYECTSLVRINIPEGITKICNGFVSGCRSLTSIVIPDYIKEIGSNAFYGCYGVTSITMPEGLGIIGDYSFENCGMRQVTIPQSVTQIGRGAFSNCYNLVSITIPESITALEYQIVANSRNLESIIFEGIDDPTETHSWSIPQGYPDISGNPGFFSGCRKLNTIIFRDKEYHVRGYKESGYTHGVYWLVDWNNTLYIYGDGEMGYFDDHTAPWRGYTDVVICDGVTSIARFAFRHYASAGIKISSVTIPASVKKIGRSAFSDISSPIKMVFLGSDTEFEDDIFTDSSTWYCRFFCYEFSTAESYARLNGIDYTLLDNLEPSGLISVSTPEEVTVSINDEHQHISAAVAPVLNDQSVVWSSGNEAIVRVSQQGLIQPVGIGTATVTLAVNGICSETTVHVIQPVTDFIFPDTIWIVGKESRLLTNDIGFKPYNATGIYSYSTADSIYASVSEDGLLTGNAVGSTTLTITETISGIKRTADVNICYPVTEIAFEPLDRTLVTSETVQLTANVTMRTQECTNQLVSFTSDQPETAEVNRWGIVQAKKPGTATITARATSGVIATITIQIKDATVLTLPDGLNRIEDEAFAGIDCNIVIVPDRCEFIGSKAFADCKNLIRIVIPMSLKNIAEDAFSGCERVEIVRH